LKPPELSDEQKALLDYSTRVVEAGPGSGKTRALAARFVATATNSKKGVALVSFTNAAVNEVRRRTYQTPELLRAPNFVGTIDSFLHRFIVTPAETARLGRRPSYWPSWDDLAETLAIVRLRNPAGAGIRLSCFRVDRAGTIALNESELRWEEGGYLDQIDKASRRSALMNRAKAVITGLMNSGTYDASAARVKADELLYGRTGPQILSRISRRFAELLVDEAQDCDDAEFDIIRRIEATGMTTLVVADPDQAIFEFRGSDPSLFFNYRDSHPLNERAYLATNYRSTFSICSAVSALRSSNVISAHNQGECAPVFVLNGGPSDQRAKFLATIAEHGVPIEDAIVLAHRLKDATTVAGCAAVGSVSGAAGNRLSWACSIIHRSNTPSERLAAVQTIERIILQLIDWPEDLRTRDQIEQLEALGQRPEWLRQAVAALVASTSGVTDAQSFGATVRDQLKMTLCSLPITALPLPQRVKKPTASVWEACEEARATTALSLTGATVHSAKGMEFGAVLLTLPAKLRKTSGLDLLNEWEQGLNSEARRVMYVGASRAKRVLAIGTEFHAERVESILRYHQVPVESR